MSFENSGSQLESQDEIPKLKEASKEDIQEIENSIKYSQKLSKVNDVLNVLDFPDNKEESFRKTLEKQDDKILKDLSKKSKKEILTFIVQEKKIELNNKTTETTNFKAKDTKNKTKIEQKDLEISKENERINSKISKIKSIFTPEILRNNSKIADELNTFDLKKNSIDKNKEILENILEILKQP